MVIISEHNLNGYNFQIQHDIFFDHCPQITA